MLVMPNNAMRTLIFYSLLIFQTTVLASVDLKSEIKKVIVSGKSPLFIHIGEKTKSILMRRGEVVDRCYIEIKSKDAADLKGDSEADVHAFVKCKGYATIGLRLKREDKDHYHILGYWTVGN